jgi:hypothetical protein
VSNEAADFDAELDAMRAAYSALKDLEPAAQSRVLDYVLNRLSIAKPEALERAGSTFSPRELAQERETTGEQTAETPKATDDELDGVSPVGQKWARRNGLSSKQLSALFSLGVDEIDLVARTVPGSSMRERMHSVILLAGAASYLGAGIARVTYEKLTETLRHYNAYDGPNFAKHMKAFSPEVAGTKESGYTLTARGLAAAADLVKQAAGSG